MDSRHKLGRNDPCPCGSGKKYKRCCEGKVRWYELLAAPSSHQSHFLSIRGKNLAFFEHIGEALQLDSITPKSNFATLKKAFTPHAVRRIHEAIPALWPDSRDYERALAAERPGVTALYVGNYQPEAVFRAITRHSLYCDRILLPDLFMYPTYVAEEFNPLLHPEKHRANTVKWAFLWFCLFPWIASGIVGFIRRPGDFNPAVYHEILGIQRNKFAANPELEEFAKHETERTVREMSVLDRGLWEYHMLSHPDAFLLDVFCRSPKGAPWKNEGEFLAFIQNRRDMHPYYVEYIPGQGGEFLKESSGASYEEAKRICAITNSHLITDIAVRWKEVELDHAHATGTTETWSPFAKALHAADLKVLNNIPLQAALHLREEDRLEAMRHFFNKVWRACREPDAYSSLNTANLAAELDHEVRNAQEEWDNIDKQLFAWLGVATGELVSSGLVGFVPAAAAAAVTGTAGLALAQWQRKSFDRRFPAGFFLSVKT